VDGVTDWWPPGGRELAAAYLLPLLTATLRTELQRPADAVVKARGRPEQRKSSDDNQN
jgi:hypothetical protein